MANDFSSDANCVALWRFEDGALGTDSIGTNDIGLRGYTYQPVADTNVYKEGASSAHLQAGTIDQVGAYFSMYDS